MERKTKEQQAFDLAVHGWSFSNVRMLENRIHEGTEIARKLKATDTRYETLDAMREVLDNMRVKS